MWLADQKLGNDLYRRLKRRQREIWQLIRQELGTHRTIYELKVVVVANKGESWWQGLVSSLVTRV